MRSCSKTFKYSGAKRQDHRPGAGDYAGMVLVLGIAPFDVRCCARHVYSVKLMTTGGWYTSASSPIVY